LAKPLQPAKFRKTIREFKQKACRNQILKFQRDLRRKTKIYFKALAQNKSNFTFEV
jgi:hypothetical protein